jgi:hypothetical protein
MNADFTSRRKLAARFLEGASNFDQEAVSCLTLLAGAGSRWIKSLSEARARLAEGEGKASGPVADFPLSAPRGLFPVRNFLGSGNPTIPLAAYALDAFRGLGRHLIVIRGWEQEIRQTVLFPLGIPESEVDFHSQREGPSGKVLGHGDATLQAFDLWKSSSYVIVNFGGDASSPLTALIALFALRELVSAGEGVDLLLPVAKIEGAAYPIYVDGEGLPRRFGHDKLGGGAPRDRDQSQRDFAVQGSATGSLRRSEFTNVGVRVYRTSALAEALEEMKSLYWRDGIGWDIPGNDPEGHEFALDNVDALLAGRGRARILPVAAPEELTPAKSFDELGRFEAAIEKVRLDWDDFRSTLGFRKLRSRLFD